MHEPYVIWLDEADGPDATQLGGKGHNLAVLRRAGFRVPNGFCVTPRACQELGASPRSGTATAGPSHPTGPTRGAVEAAVCEAYGRLGASHVAVRSSGLEEDQAHASYAGQQETFLNVTGEEALLEAVHRCCASLFGDRATAYRAVKGTSTDPPRMAVVVQEMIPAEVAGVAFSIDPVTGTRQVVIEAARGLGEGVVGGRDAVERWRVDSSTRRISGPASRKLLSCEQIRELAGVATELERIMGGPQDIEWGWRGDTLYLLQSRPVTARPGGFFTEVLAGDDHLWTSGFLNERFTKPVSPLGWSLMRELLEPLAFRDSLRFMGYRVPPGLPLLKLFRGHPFVNARVFQILYRPFPVGLLPDDARRFFPGGQTDLRYDAPYPRGWWDPRWLGALLRLGILEGHNWMPACNHRSWDRFKATHECTMTELWRKAGDGSGDLDPRQIWEIFAEAQILNRRLLAIHRWSLTHADISYSLLRRLLTRWLGSDAAANLAPRLVSGLANRSTELNRALEELSRDGDWDQFAAQYGHRSFGLDVALPTFAEMPDVMRRLAAGAGAGADRKQRDAERRSAVAQLNSALGRGVGGWLKARCLWWARHYAARYMPLREEQRFFWQRTLALQRHLLRRLGSQWAQGGLLERADDLFHATLDEIRGVLRGEPPPIESWRARGAEYARLLRDFEGAPQFCYPRFLRGNVPLDDAEERVTHVLQGQPVSPGLARGPARIVLSPDQFDHVRPGDILVARGMDPGWTPLFGRAAGLVMEVGGQLSHAAVVAREYGLPAVTGVTDATIRFEEGEEIIVDGLSGVVRTTRLSASGESDQPTHP
ncbi:MAG: hypothetical protein KJ072_23885 [Verrucomicrobia bacterium]|nr:hypothetical protein [Verrucomicrobiota bacterium]